MFEVLRRVSLACAIALTIALLVAGVMPSAGQAFGGELHRRAHLVSFAVLALAWRWSLPRVPVSMRSEEHTSELQSLTNLVCRLLLEKKNKITHKKESI